MNAPSQSGACRVRRYWSRSRCGRHRGSAPAHPKGSGHSGWPGRSASRRRAVPGSSRARSSAPRPAAWLSPAGPPGAPRRCCRGSRLRPRRVRRFASEPRWQSVPGAIWRGQRTACANGPNRMRASPARRRASDRRGCDTRHSRRFATHRNSPSAAPRRGRHRAPGRSCTPPPAAPRPATAGRRGRAPRSTPSWCAPARDRAPAPSSRRRTAWSSAATRRPSAATPV